MLSGAQREEGLTAARDALAKQEALFIAKFGAAQRELIMKILKEELAKRPLTARRNLAAKWASTQGAPPEVSNRG
jgi:hypothetical protein